AGDLVAWTWITRGMPLPEAKEYVAGKLGGSTLDLSDPTVMFDVRKEFGLGGILESGEVTDVDDPIGIEAKFNIAAVLDVPVSCVERFRTKAGRRGPGAPRRRRRTDGAGGGRCDRRYTMDRRLGPWLSIRFARSGLPRPHSAAPPAAGAEGSTGGDAVGSQV